MKRGCGGEGETDQAKEARNSNPARGKKKGALPRGVHTEKPNSSGFSDPKCKPTKRNEDLTQDAKIEIFH
jgi:hypothetical protein